MIPDDDVKDNEYMEYELARALAVKLVEALKTSDSCLRVAVAGSVRRQKPEVKDVELVVITKDYDKLFAALSPFGRFIKPGTSEIVDWPPKQGARYLRMLLSEGIKLDLFIAHEANWGGILMLRTGAAADDTGNIYAGFGPGILSLWKRKSGGGRMVQGQFVRPDNTVIPLYEEKDVFNILDIEYVDPVNRTSRKAIKKRGAT